jgi:hypothetical protein
MQIRLGAFVLILCTTAEVAAGTTYAQALYTAPSGVETRSASPENPRRRYGTITSGWSVTWTRCESLCTFRSLLAAFIYLRKMEVE